MSLSWFRESHQVPAEQRGPVLDPVCLQPKLSVRIPEELHVRLRHYAIDAGCTVQQLVLEALSERIAKPPTPKRRGKAADKYSPGNMIGQ